MYSIYSTRQKLLRGSKRPTSCSIRLSNWPTKETNENLAVADFTNSPSADNMMLSTESLNLGPRNPIARKNASRADRDPKRSPIQVLWESRDEGPCSAILA